MEDADQAGTGSDAHGSPDNHPAATDSVPDTTDTGPAHSGAPDTPNHDPTVTETTTDCSNPADNTGSDNIDAADNDMADDDAADDRPWDTDDDFDLPASAFRPDPHPPTPDPDPGGATTSTDPTHTATADPPVGRDQPPTAYRKGRPVITPCPNDHHTKPIPATIGVIISAQSLLGYSNTPGQLTDRSALIPTDLIRDLARQPGTLFYRLLTDDKGNLLDVTDRSRLTKPVRRDLCAQLRLTTSSQATVSIPVPETRQRHRLPGRHLHHPDLHHPGPPLRPRPRHPRPRRTHHRGQPEQQLPPRTPSENPRRPPHLPRGQHHDVNHRDRPHLRNTDQPFPVEQWPTREEQWPTQEKEHPDE